VSGDKAMHGRHHVRYPGDTISKCPGDFVGIRKQRGIGFMTRKLILLFALSVAAVTVGISTYAQQPPTGTPTDLVAMTEPPIPAPAGFNNKTNGFTDQDEFDKDREAFEDVETIVPEKKSSVSRSQTASNSEETQTKGGLGPVYNATSCVTCHQNPITGSSSQVSELRAGRRKDPGDPNSDFIEPPGGSLIHQRAIDSRSRRRKGERALA
jgi:hypothetical protein